MTATADHGLAVASGASHLYLTGGASQPGPGLRMIPMRSRPPVARPSLLGRWWSLKRTHCFEIASHSRSTSCHSVRMFPMATRMVNLPASTV